MLSILSCKFQFLMGRAILYILSDCTLFLERYGVVDLSDCDMKFPAFSNWEPVCTHTTLCKINSVSVIPLAKL